MKPLRIGQDVKFEYDKGCYFTVELLPEGALNVKIVGVQADLLATHHHVSNDARMVARRWNDELGRYMDFTLPYLERKERL